MACGADLSKVSVSGRNETKSRGVSLSSNVTAEQLHEAILVAQQLFISAVVDRKKWLGQIN